MKVEFSSTNTLSTYINDVVKLFILLSFYARLYHRRHCRPTSRQRDENFDYVTFMSSSLFERFSRWHDVLSNRMVLLPTANLWRFL